MKTGRFANAFGGIVGLCFAFAVTAALTLAPVPAEAQLKNLFKKLNEDVNKNNQEKKSDSDSNVTSNMSEKEKTKKKAPVNDGKIGEEPIALVEDIKNAPNAKIELMDTVFKNQLINLGGKGKVHLSFVESCHEELINGGQVIVAADPRTGGSKVSGGRLRIKNKACAEQNTKLVALKSDSREFGSSSDRQIEKNPYEVTTWKEKTISIRTPMFTWARRSAGRSKIEVLFMDNSSGPKVIWRSRTSRKYVRYPSRARRLRVGSPYIFRVTHSDGTVVTGGFSYDPSYERPKNLAANTVIAGR